jgi:hypothetical protein
MLAGRLEFQRREIESGSAKLLLSQFSDMLAGRLALPWKALFITSKPINRRYADKAINRKAAL